MKAQTVRETDIAADFITWLERHHSYACHEEKTVYLPARGNGLTPDIIAVKDDIIAIAECKVRLTHDVIDQARRWHGFAHKISIVVRHPGKCPTRQHTARVALCRGERFGLVYRKNNGEIQVAIEAPVRRGVNISPISEALSAGITLRQPAGTPAPLGRSAGRESDALQAAREHLAAWPWDQAKYMARVLGWSKKQTNDFINKARRGELQRYGITHRNANGVMEFAVEEYQ